MSTASYPTTSVGRRRGSASAVVAGSVLALLTFLAIYKFGILSIFGATLVLGFLWLLMLKPQMATLLFVVVMYSNAAAVSIRTFHVPTPVAMGSFLLAFLPMVRYVVLRKEPIRIDAIMVLMAVYFSIMVISALLSHDPTESRETVVNYFFEGMVVYLLVINTVRSPDVLLKSVRLIALVAAVLGTMSAVQWYTKNYDRTFGGFAAVDSLLPDGTYARTEIDTDEHLRGEQNLRAFGPVADPNFYGQILVAALPMALVPALRCRTRRARLIALAACMPIVAGIVLTYSRGAGVAALLLCLIMLLMRYVKLWHVLLVGAVIAAVVASDPSYSERMSTLTDAGQQGVHNADASVAGRALILQAGVQRFLQHPILGVGPGQSPNYIGTYDQSSQFGSVRQIPLHNTYLQQLVETGIVGFVCFMAIVYVAIRNLLRAARYWEKIRPEYAQVASSLVFSLIGFLSASLFLHMPYVMLRYYALLLGLSGAAIYVYRPATPSSPEANSSPAH
jgi:O-antigen ligase